jgi:uncharacterized damage-inducible protein DinB
MDAAVAAVAQYFTLNDTLFERAITGLSDEELRRFPVGDANPMIWIAGHVAASRAMLAGMLDGEAAVAYPELFGQKSQPSAEAAYPPVAQIHQALKDAGARLRKRFENMTDADLLAPAPRRFPNGDPTLRGAIVFLAYHESYHIGQMAYVRKCLGYPGIVDAQ